MRDFHSAGGFEISRAKASDTCKVREEGARVYFCSRPGPGPFAFGMGLVFWINKST